MNNRSGVNESSLVNFSADLPSLDAKDSLLSFPFDHLYACHSESSDQRDVLELNKVVDLPGAGAVGDNLGAAEEPSVNQLNSRLTASENQNKRLKDLLIYHLDLIQQQNELITRRDKLYQALLHENETLKSKLHRKYGVSQPALVSAPTPVAEPSSTPPAPPPTALPAPSPPLSSAVKAEPSQIMLNSVTELLLPEIRTNPFLFDEELSATKTFEKETFGIARTTTPTEPEEPAKPVPMRPIPKKGIYKDVKPFMASDIGTPAVLESSKSKYSNMRCDGYKAVDGKRSLIKKEAAKSEPLYTVTSNSGSQVIQKVQRRKRSTAGVGHLSRMPKNTPKTDTTEPSKVPDEPSFDHFGINKKSKTVNTYGKSKNASASTAATSAAPLAKRAFGSLSDRLQLIDTTPTGEDPYQLGEADLREQSPIPKLMLQKTNHGRMKVLDQPTRRIYDPDLPETKRIKMRPNRFLSNTFTTDVKTEAKTMMIQEPDLDLVKTEPEIDWRVYSPKMKTSIETCTSSTPPLPLNDFTLSDSPSNAASTISLDCNEFQDLFTSDSALNLEDLNVATSFSSTQKMAAERSRKRCARILPPLLETLEEPMDFPPLEPQVTTETKEASGKRGRKRAHSTTGLGRGGRGAKVPAKRARGRPSTRGKNPPPPARTTKTEYHTHVGDPDLSWYFGLDPEIKTDDIDPPADQKSATVEVPRWREKPYTSTNSSEGIENMDDKVFEKRHQKLEAEERRQLRWHMRRIREQRHLEKLKQRQRYEWCATAAPPAVYTLWPRPQRDVRAVEITDTLPVMAFGEPIPDLPPSDFKLPWVRTSKALKRSKRSKTLH